MRFSHTLSTCKHYYVYSTIIVLAMTLFLAGCPSPNDTTPPPPPQKNDLNPLLTITPTRASVTEGGTSTFTITRDNVEGALEVSLTLSGSAEHNVDYTVDPTVNTDSSTGDKTMTVVFENSKKSVDITITAKNDEDTEVNGEEVVITIKESGDYTIGDRSTATLTIVDPAPSDAPVVSISTSDENNAVNEGGTITVTISSSKEVPNGLEVSLTIGGTATIDEDYELPGVTTTTSGGTVTATVTINDGEKSATITIPVHDDNDHEEDETVVMSIDPSSNYHINNGEESATVTILNDDLPTVGFRTTSQTLQEGDDEGVTVIVERSTDEVRDVLTVQLKIEGDVESVSDYETLSDTVTFKSGEDIATITLTAGDDGAKEEEQRVIITIETSDGYTVGDSRTATVTIIDPVVADLPTISISASPSEVNEGEDITITVRSNIPVTGELMVSFTIDDVTNSAQQGDDYALDPESNTVTINDGKQSATITIRVHDDDDHEKNEDIQITISDSSSYYIKEGEKTVTVTITDDDLPIVGFSSTSQTLDEGNGESVTVTVTVERSNDEALLPLEVQLAFEGDATEGEDYEVIKDDEAITRSVTIGSGEDDTDFTLQLRGDEDVEVNEEVIITIASAATYHIDEANDEVIITIVNDDTSEDDIDGDTIENSKDVDDDNDGLIEIHTLEMLHNVHFNLAGTSYDDEEDDSAGNEGDTNGAPTSPTEHCNTPVNEVFLCGYELTGNLDFIDAGSYDADTINTEWQPSDADSPEENPDDATNEGFPGIGAATGSSGGFTGIFEGNGHSISNLYMRNTTDAGRYFTGLFRSTGAGAKIRNLGMMNVAIYGGAGNNDRVGGLVGAKNGGTITASYATGTVNGGAGNNDYVGGLVGDNFAGAITASYATGTVDGGDGGNDRVGGLVGANFPVDITASYATGDVDGGDGDSDNVGGLVGYNNYGTITASYATGDVDGGDGNNDYVGDLVGINDEGAITASYGFGTHSGGTVNSDDTTTLTGVTMASHLTQGNAGTEWNSAYSKTLDAWDFGTSSQNPALKYADYDGLSGTTYSCGPVPTCGSFLPEQGR